MHLTDFTDYSLRVLIYLNKTKKLATLNELSRRLAISRNNLIKVSSKLEKLGYITTVRGRSGGLQISPETPQVSLGTIVRKTEERMQLAECFSNGKILCTLQHGCLLKNRLHEALEAFMISLDKYSLNDITPEFPLFALIQKS